MRTALFWAVTQRVVVIPYRCFGASYRSHLQGLRIKEEIICHYVRHTLLIISGNEHSVQCYNWERLLLCGPRENWEQMERRKMWVHPIICDGRNIGLFWAIFENMRRDKAAWWNYFRMCVGSWRTVWDNWVLSTNKQKKKKKKKGNQYRPETKVTIT